MAESASRGAVAMQARWTQRGCGGWLRAGTAEGSGGAGGGQPRAGAVAAKEQVGDSQRTGVCGGGQAANRNTIMIPASVC